GRQVALGHLDLIELLGLVAPGLADGGQDLVFDPHLELLGVLCVRTQHQTVQATLSDEDRSLTTTLSQLSGNGGRRSVELRVTKMCLGVCHTVMAQNTSHNSQHEPGLAVDHHMADLTEGLVAEDSNDGHEVSFPIGVANTAHTTGPAEEIPGPVVCLGPYHHAQG